MQPCCRGLQTSAAGLARRVHGALADGFGSLSFWLERAAAVLTDVATLCAHSEGNVPRAEQGRQWPIALGGDDCKDEMSAT